MRLCLLGSGSTGNVAFIEAGATANPTRLLVDAGLSRREVERRLATLTGATCDGEHRALTLADVTAVLVTHDHRDHVGCAKKLGVPVYAPAASLRLEGIDGVRVLADKRFSVGAIAVHPVQLPHDADETVGYVLEHDGARVGILTDCGWDDPAVARAYAGCSVLVLEANHDAELLANGPYPTSIKRRVSGRRGHLSNEQSASLLGMMLQHGPPPSLVIAAHLSKTNNRPLLAKRALEEVMKGRGKVVVATADMPTTVFQVSARQLMFSFPQLESVAS